MLEKYELKITGLYKQIVSIVCRVCYVRTVKRFVFDRIVIGLREVRQSYCYIKASAIDLATETNRFVIPPSIRLPTHRHGPGKTTPFQGDAILHKLCKTTGLRDGFYQSVLIYRYVSAPGLRGLAAFGTVSAPFYY